MHRKSPNLLFGQIYVRYNNLQEDWQVGSQDKVKVIDYLILDTIVYLSSTIRRLYILQKFSHRIA